MDRDNGGIISREDITNKVETKPYNLIEESFKHQIGFDKVSTALGKLIILSYLLIIIVSFLLHLLGFCVNCYPDFLKTFESLVLIIIGFFFGTRLIHQYLPIEKNK